MLGGMSIAAVTPNVSAGAQALLDLLYRLSGTATMTGQHNQPIHGSAWTERITGITGAVPALWGFEIGFSAPGTLDGIDRREANLAEAIAWHERGAVITATWHAVSPPDDEPVEFRGGIIRDLSAGERREVLRPGSNLYRRWCAQVDLAAGLLGRLGEAGVPVLWRPYHEMNGPWFWWGGDAEFLVGLWHQLYERLVGGHGLTNLVWVWSPNAAYGDALPFPPFFPGHEVVDVLGMDTYGGHYEPEHYRGLLDLAGGRPLGLGEVGALPPAATLAEQPGWTWFMGWPDAVLGENDEETVRARFADPRMVNLDALPSWGWLPRR
jgi:mannan endo-1,4-beta-mannosidase